MDREPVRPEYHSVVGRSVRLETAGRFGYNAAHFEPGSAGSDYFVTRHTQTDGRCNAGHLGWFDRQGLQIRHGNTVDRDE